MSEGMIRAEGIVDAFMKTCDPFHGHPSHPGRRVRCTEHIGRAMPGAATNCRLSPVGKPALFSGAGNSST